MCRKLHFKFNIMNNQKLTFKHHYSAGLAIFSIKYYPVKICSFIGFFIQQ